MTENPWEGEAFEKANGNPRLSFLIILIGFRIRTIMRNTSNVLFYVCQISKQIPGFFMLHQRRSRTTTEKRPKNTYSQHISPPNLEKSYVSQISFCVYISTKEILIIQKSV